MHIAKQHFRPPLTNILLLVSVLSLLSQLSQAQNCSLPLSSNGDTLWATQAILFVRAGPAPVVGEFRWGMTPTEVWNIARGNSNQTFSASEYPTSVLWSACAGRDVSSGGIPLFGTTNSSQNANIVFFYNYDANQTPSLFRIEIRYYTPDRTIMADFISKTQNNAKRTDFSSNSQVQTIYEYRGSTVYSAAATFSKPSMTVVEFVNLGLGINLPLYNDPTQYGVQDEEFPGLACRGCSWPIPFTSGQVSPSIDGACPTTGSGWGVQIGYSCSVACIQTQAAQSGTWTCTADTQTGLTQWDTTLKCTATSGCTQVLPLNNSYSAGGTNYGSACPYPPPTTGFQLAEGISCSVLCNTNVAVAGQSGFQCKGGQWVDLQQCQPQPTLPTCDSIPTPAIGEGRESNCSAFASAGHYAVGSKCSSYCLDGYQGSPSTADWQCVSSTAPGGVVATWQGGVKCIQAVCSIAPNPSTGEDFSPCATMFTHASVGASCSTKCSSNYIGGGGLYVCSVTTVNGNSTVAWVGGANCTIAPKCNQPPSLNPGEDRTNSPCSTALANSQAPFDIGSTCISDCASTYDGIAAAWTCTSNVTSATWVGGPLCTPKPQCQVPALSLGEDRSTGTCGNAFATATAMFDAGFSCTSGCATGFVGTAGTWLCGTDGSWSQGPLCRKPDACALADATNIDLVNLRSGSNPCLTGDQTRASASWPVGSNCTVGCSAGATGSGGFLTCTASLTWIDSFKCEAVSPIACKAAPTTVLGVDLSSGDHPCQPSTTSTSNPDGWTAGAECTAACGPDYSGSPAPFTCQSDGTWSGGPTCQAASSNVVTVSCAGPPPIDPLMDFTVGTAPCVALVVGQRYKVGSVCSAGCNSSLATGATAVYQCQPTAPGSDTATWTGGPVCARSCIPSSIPTDSSINLSGGSAPCSSISGLPPGSSCTASCTLQSTTIVSYRCNFVTSVWDLPSSSSCPAVAEACLVSNLASQSGVQLDTTAGSVPCSTSTAWQPSSQCTASCSSDSSTTLTVTCGSGGSWIIPSNVANCNQTIIAASHLTLYDFPHATTKVIVSAAVAGGLAAIALATAFAAAPLAVGASNSVRGCQLVGFACCRESILLKVSYVYLGQISFLFLCVIQIAISIGLLVAFGYQASIEAGWSMLLPRWAALGVYVGMVGIGIFAVLVDRFCVQDYEAENANYGLIIPGEVERAGSGCCACACCSSDHARNSDGTICTLYCRNRVRSIAVFNFGTRAASLVACVLTIINWSSMSALSWVLVIWHISQGYIVLLAILLAITWLLGEACRRATEPIVWRLIIPRVYVRDTDIAAYQYLPDALEQQVEENEEFQALYEKRPKKFSYLHWLRRSSGTCWAWRKTYNRPTSTKKAKVVKEISPDDGIVVSKLPPSAAASVSIAGNASEAAASATPMDPSLLPTTTRTATSTPNVTPAVSLLSPVSISRGQSLPVSRNNIPPPVIVEQQVNTAAAAPVTCVPATTTGSTDAAATEAPSHAAQLYVYDADDDEGGWAEV